MASATGEESRSKSGFPKANVMRASGITLKKSVDFSVSLCSSTMRTQEFLLRDSKRLTSLESMPTQSLGTTTI
jgi:hypothetical protein